MKKKILVLFDTVDEGFEELTRRYEVVRPPKGKSFSDEDLEKMPHDFDVICSEFSIPMTPEKMGCYPQLKMVANYAVGYNNIDLEYARNHNIVVANTPQSVIIPTAEHTMALLLSCSRRIAEWDRSMRRKRSSEKSLRDSAMGTDLYGKTIGIIGFGNIGRAVARLAQAFGMKVLYNKRTRLEAEEEAQLMVQYASVATILKECEVISLHTPYNADSHHLIDEKALGEMKPNAILINAARGPVVDEQALVQALQENRIYAAGLDVYEHSDNPLDPLYDLEQVTLTPHVGTQTYESRVRMVREMCDNIIGFLEGDRPISRVV